MLPTKDMTFHPTSERLVDILCQRAQNNNPLFFRVHVAYYFALVASMMRCKIKTMDRGTLPVNLYAINLSTSGSGKGCSTNIMEEEVLEEFLNRFLGGVFPLMAEENIPKISLQRAARKGSDPDVELERAYKEFENLGPLVTSFDSGTTAAVRQARQKLLMADVGSLNLQIDEIGSNLTSNLEVLTTFLELYDIGKIKQKLIKNTSDNARYEDIPGRTPTNMMLFGTPSRLLNGGKAEEEFYSMLDTGYARRCFFGYSLSHTRNTDISPDDLLAQRTDKGQSTFITDLSQRLGMLADRINVDSTLSVSKPVTLLFIEYQLACEKLAEALPEHEEMKKAEMSHRYFKALKLAGAYAFIDGVPEITENHAYYAIKLAEESGAAFDRLLTRDRPYVKLAKYIASVNRNITQADLVEDLPFYPRVSTHQRDMMTLAIAYGYQNNILIKKTFSDGIEFVRGECLKVTDLNNMRVSYSKDIAVDYISELAPFNKLHLLTQTAGLHWCNHYLTDGHRQEDNAIPGFNLIVLDVDSGVNLSTAKLLLQEHKALFYTTKRHTDKVSRFRIVIPTNYELELDAKDYKEFMTNVYDWLPFEVDRATNQRARKWLAFNGHYEYQDGEILDVLPFIPKTTKNEVRKQLLTDQHSLDNLERWVINNTGDGNRNNQLLRYAMILVDAGFDFDDIRKRVMGLNDKMVDKLDEAEILGTIMVSAGKAISKR